MKRAPAAAPAKDEKAEVQIVVKVPDSVLPGHYCNFVQIRHSAYDIILDFTLLTPPDSPELSEKIQREKKIVANASVRVIVPAPVAPSLVDALEKQIAKWKAAVSEGQASEEKR